MTRLDEILKYTTGREIGIEIAPYFNPALPKRVKPNMLTMDVFDTATLRQNASADPFIENARIKEIEEVDLVGSATQIEELVDARGLKGRIEFIISSHNFEHLPNPIKLLKGCEAVLATGGVISMAIPDGRACFDHFRPFTALSDWLDAYADNRDAPTRSQIFEGNAMRALYRQPRTGTLTTGCNLASDDPELFAPCEMLEASYAEWKRGEPDTYVDCHCSVMSNTSFEILMRDLQFLGIIKLSVGEISETRGHEFFAHLVKDEASAPPSAAFYERRKQLLVKMSRELGASGFPMAHRSNVGQQSQVSMQRGHKTKSVTTRLSSEVKRWRRQLNALLGPSRLP